MKKFLSQSISLSIILIITFALFSNVNKDTKNGIQSDLFIANVEALANGESGSQPMDCVYNVENTNDGKPVETKTYCGDCQPIKCTHWSNNSRCTR
ncbi:NVEALA domain-containing protein [Parabacteroides goldsteinii]|uniref:NVEALA domain-containing protein n=1 Tax=Parabacteroides goldsteinii TaxID=328812 RepID=UPI003AF196E9